MSKIKDVFKDYQKENSLVDAEIENINLFKKSKKIEIELNIQEPLKIYEMLNFEDYLKERFQIQRAIFKIINNEKYDMKDLSQQIKNDWKDIVKYLSKNFPLCKTILGTSIIKIEDNRLIVYLKNKVASFLLSN